MDFILYLMCYIKQIIMLIGEKKFYNTDFVFVKDIPAELDLSFGNDIEPKNLREIFLLQ